MDSNTLCSMGCIGTDVAESMTVVSVDTCDVFISVLVWERLGSAGAETRDVSGEVERGD